MTALDKPFGAIAPRRRFPKLAVYVVGFAPAAWTIYLGLSDRLGPEPVRTLEQHLGLWALRFLLASLAVTPLRQIVGLDVLRHRRALGLLAFYYAMLHLLAYVGLDHRFDWRVVWTDIFRRPYVTVGMASFAILVPLAATSNNAMIRLLGGKTWSRLHRLVYFAVIAAALHFVLIVKSWPPEPLIYAGVAAVLLGYRLARRLSGDRTARNMAPMSRASEHRA
jgi:sulfoxide reductase heme-binding subunit YedZ